MFVYIVVLALAASIDIAVCTNGENDCGLDSFTCEDGACVSWESYCDGIQHCADKSDEEGCIQHSSNESCVLPDYPEHGTYTVNGEPGARPGQSYPSAYLTVTCDPGYEVVGSNSTYCFSGIGWMRSIPYCSRFCKLTPHPSVNYKCKVTGVDGQVGTRMCNEYEPSGTVIIPECSPNYNHPSGVLTNMRCIDGNWDTTAICQPGTLNVGTNVTVKVNDKFYINVSGTDYSISIDDVTAVKIQAHQNVAQLILATNPTTAKSMSSEKPISSVPIASSAVSSIKPLSEAPIVPRSLPVMVKLSTPVPSTRVPTTDDEVISFQEAATPHVVYAPAVTPVDPEDYYNVDPSLWRSGT